MTRRLKRLHDAVGAAALRLVPRPMRIRLSAEGYSICRFMEEAARQVRPTDRVLDAGAGDCPYKDLFAHARYESTDWQEGRAATHTFLCDLHHVPRLDASYDVILSTQVLQHVEYPQQVVREFARLLKPGGRLFLTTCQGWPVIQPPYHFYNFTNFGLASIFRNAGLQAVTIRPRGGAFWALGHRLRELPLYLLSQYRSNKATFLLLLPFYLIGVVVLGFFVPLCFHYLDRLDKEQRYTLGYACCCVKDAPGAAPAAGGGPVTDTGGSA